MWRTGIPPWKCIDRTETGGWKTIPTRRPLPCQHHSHSSISRRFPTKTRVRLRLRCFIPSFIIYPFFLFPLSILFWFCALLRHSNPWLLLIILQHAHALPVKGAVRRRSLPWQARHARAKTSSSFYTPQNPRYLQFLPIFSPYASSVCYNSTIKTG